MRSLIILICASILLLSFALLVSAVSENRLAERVQKLEKTLQEGKNTPQRLEIKYIK